MASLSIRLRNPLFVASLMSLGLTHAANAHPNPTCDDSQRSGQDDRNQTHRDEGRRREGRDRGRSNESSWNRHHSDETPGMMGWNSEGWEQLGGTRVDGRRNTDRIEIGERSRRFRTLVVTIDSGDLDIYDFVVRLGDGESFRPNTRMHFREGSRTGFIDLPGAARNIRDVTFRYGNIGRGASAQVQVWGMSEALPTIPTNSSFGTWVSLGESVVNGARDQDILRIAPNQGPFRQLMIEVANSDLVLEAMTVKFRNGEHFAPNVGFTFRDGSRSAAIELPGENRFIDHVFLRYRNVGRRDNARLTLWGSVESASFQVPREERDEPTVTGRWRSVRRTAR